MVRLFIHRENVKHLAKLLQQTRDPARREVIRKLLAEEEAQFAKCLRERQVQSIADAFNDLARRPRNPGVRQRDLISDEWSGARKPGG